MLLYLTGERKLNKEREKKNGMRYASERREKWRKSAKIIILNSFMELCIPFACRVKHNRLLLIPLISLQVKGIKLCKKG
jgi:hypothetical protein